jgi:hypothetical protein
MNNTLKKLIGKITCAALLMASAAMALEPSHMATMAGRQTAATAAVSSGPVYHCVPFVRFLTLPLPNGSSGGNPLFNGVASQLFSNNIAAVNQTAIKITGVPASGPNGAGSICHADALALFNGTDNTATYGANGVSTHNSAYINTNHVWSNRNELCTRIFHNDHQQHFLGVYEIITEMGGPVTGHTGGYNQVGGIVVICDGQTNPATNIPAPVVVPALPL